MDLSWITKEVLTSVMLSNVFTGVLAWLFKGPLAQWLQSGFEHRFNTKLAEIESTLRQKDQKHASELSKQENEMNSVRDGILGGVFDKQKALSNRRIIAVERLWNSVIEMRKDLMIVNAISMVDLEKAIEITTKEENLRTFFIEINKTSNADQKLVLMATQERPFLSNRVVELFDVYNHIITQSKIYSIALANGYGTALIKSDENDGANWLQMKVQDLLPHYANYSKVQIRSTYHKIIGEVDKLLEKEIRVMLEGAELDTTAVSGSLRSVEQIFVEAQNPQILVVPTEFADTKTKP